MHNCFLMHAPGGLLGRRPHTPAWRALPGGSPAHRPAGISSSRPPRRRRTPCPGEAPIPRRYTPIPLATPSSRVEGVAASPTVEAVLESCGSAWPGWARNAYRLLQPSGAPVPDAPTPQEAAAALKALAKRAAQLPPRQRPAALSRHRVILGLLECLRVAPPRDLDAAELSGALWALGVLGRDLHYEAELEALAARLPGVRFTRLLQVADVCWALGAARHWTPHLALLEREAVRLVQAALGAGSWPDAPGRSAGSVRCAPLASAAWGLSVLGHPPLRLLGLLPALLRRWGEEAGRQGGGEDSNRRDRPSITSLCTLAWCLAVAGSTQREAWPSVLGALGRAAASEAPAGRGRGPSAQQWMQLHQVALALGGLGQLEPVLQEAGLAPEAAGSLRGLFSKAAEAAGGLAGDKRLQQVSGCQADVVRALLSIGLPEVLEEWQAVPGLVVDAAVPSLRLAVEVDGPTHFTRNYVPWSAYAGALSLDPEAASNSEEAAPWGSEGEAGAPWSSGNSGGGRRAPMGATLLKHRMLRQAGWRVVHVDTEGWEKLRGPEEKRHWLAGALRAAGVAAAAGPPSG